MNNPMPKSHGPRRKSRHIMKRELTSRGVSFLLTKYALGDKVIIKIDPREHHTMPHRRYHGKIGIIKSVGRRSLIVGVALGNKSKILQTNFNHVRSVPSNPGQSDGR